MNLVNSRWDHRVYQLLEAVGLHQASAEQGRVEGNVRGQEDADEREESDATREHDAVPETN